jgi:8-oxo-dGTP diphosphatase
MDAIPVLEVVCALIEDEAGRLLLAQRPAGKHLAGLWEFPGGKIEAGESPRAALIREIAEELGCVATPGVALTPVTHAYEKVTVRLMPFLARLESAGATPEAREHAALRWVTRAEIGTMPMPAADAPIVAEWVARGDSRASACQAGEPA